MNKENFEYLLADFFTIYNRSKINDIPFLIERYNGKEYDAIKTMFFKYNYPKNPNYDPQKGTDKHVSYLIKKYSEGVRILSKEFFDKEKDIIKRKEEEEEIKRLEKEKEISEKISDASESVTKTKKEIIEFFQKEELKIKKYIEGVEKEISKKIKDFNDYKEKHDDKNNNKSLRTSLKLTLEDDSADLVLPEDNILNNMGVGDRAIIRDSEGNIHGIEIKSILYDCISSKEESIKEIIIGKA